MGRVALLEALPSQHAYRSLRRLQAKESREQKMIQLHLQVGQLKYDCALLHAEVLDWRSWFAQQTFAAETSAQECFQQADAVLQELAPREHIASVMEPVSEPLLSTSVISCTGCWQPLPTRSCSAEGVCSLSSDENHGDSLVATPSGWPDLTEAQQITFQETFQNTFKETWLLLDKKERSERIRIESWKYYRSCTPPETSLHQPFVNDTETSASQDSDEYVAASDLLFSDAERACLSREPIRPRSAYFLFVQEAQEGQNVPKDFAAEWKHISDERRKGFEEKALSLKLQYERDFADYSKSVWGCRF